MVDGPDFELPAYQGIALLDPKEDLHHTEWGFESKPRIIGDLGTANITLTKYTKHDLDDEDFKNQPAFAVVNGQVVRDSVESLSNQNLFGATIKIEHIPDKIGGMKCYMYIPSIGIAENRMLVSSDPPLPKEGEPSSYFAASSNRWQLSNEPHMYSFFTNKDPEFIRNLRFHFEPSS